MKEESEVAAVETKGNTTKKLNNDANDNDYSTMPTTTKKTKYGDEYMYWIQ